MDPVTMVIVPGVLGGLVIAALFAWLGRTSRQSDRFAAELPSTDIINMARIRVVGIGGLGLVAMAVAVAVSIPRIRLSMAVGLAFGVLVAVLLAVWRRHAGPMPSSGRRPGANTILSIETSTSRDNERTIDFGQRP